MTSLPVGPAQEHRSTGLGSDSGHCREGFGFTLDSKSREQEPVVIASLPAGPAPGFEAVFTQNTSNACHASPSTTQGVANITTDKSCPRMTRSS